MSSTDKQFTELKNSILKSPQLRQIGFFPDQVKDWKQNDFALLSNTIAKRLGETNKIPQSLKNSNGTTISVSTLERIFKHGYSLTVPIEARKIKTLNKLCWFLGYKSWEAFIEKNNTTANTLNNSNLIENIDIFMTQALQAEFDAYLRLPKIETEHLLKYFLETGPAYKRIYHVLNLHISKNWTLSTNHNPSYFEVLQHEISSQSEDLIEIKTREYWYLRWHESKRPERDALIYDKLNEQYYRIEKKNGLWKISINFYGSSLLK